jgi:citrate lyase subunit beta/citryl-CoA lyase
LEVLRSLLFVPGNREDMLQKSLQLSPDILVPDMEDSVPASQKIVARDCIRNFLSYFQAESRNVIPRINSLTTGMLEEDLVAVVGKGILGVSVGKIDFPEEIDQISKLLDNLERTTCVPIGSTKLIPWIETARGVLNAVAICQSSPRILGVAFGAEDFTSDMGVPRSEGGEELFFARNAVALAARAARIEALDTPYVNFRDLDGLKDESVKARRLGFRGKFAIHPGQISVINDSFSPSSEEINYAREVLGAIKEAELKGKGATSLDGKMIDAPVVERARKLLAIAEIIEENS